MTEKRFRYSSTTQIITDDLTGYTYYGNKKVCDLLNQLNDDADKKIAKLVDENFHYKKQINKYKNME